MKYKLLYCAGFCVLLAPGFTFSASAVEVKPGVSQRLEATNPSRGMRMSKTMGSANAPAAVNIAENSVVDAPIVFAAEAPVKMQVQVDVRIEDNTPLGLFAAYEKARQYDAQYKSAQASNTKTSEEINKARAAFLPKVQLTASKGRGQTDSTSAFTSQSTNRDYDTQNYNLSLRQPLFNKQAFAEYRLAKANVGRADALLAGESVNLVSRLTDAYLNTLFTEDNLRYNQSRSEALKQQLLQAKSRYKAGVGTITEVNEVQASLDLNQAQLIELNNNNGLNRRALESMIGVYPTKLKHLQPEKMVLLSDKPENAAGAVDAAQAWVDTAMQSNAQVLAAQKQVEAATQEIERSSAGHYPTLEIVASRSITESENNITIGSKFDTKTLALQLNMPIFAGGYVSASVRQSVAALEEANERLNLAKREVSSDVRGFYGGLANAVSSIQAYEQAEKSGRAALIGTKKGFEYGTRTNVEVLDSDEKLYETLRNLARARYQYVTNLIKLKESAGTLSADDIQQVSDWFVGVSNY